MNNKMTIKFTANENNVGFARSVIGAFCVSSNPTIDVISDVKTAVSEAVTNAIIHGYKGQGGEIVIDAEILDDILYLSIKDSGTGIENVEMALKDFYTTKRDDSKPSFGTTVLMKKQLA